MAVLEYATIFQRRFHWWQWTITILAGALGGYLVSIVAYDAMLTSLAGGMQITISDIGEPLRETMAFAAVNVLAGILIVVSAMFICRFTQPKLWRWLLLLLVVFAASATAEFLYERWVWTPRNSGRITVYLREVPVLTAPVVGCIAVICFVIATVMRRRFAAWPAE